MIKHSINGRSCILEMCITSLVVFEEGPSYSKFHFIFAFTFKLPHPSSTQTFTYSSPVQKKTQLTPNILPRKSRASAKHSSTGKPRRRLDSLEELIEDVAAVDKSWESEEDSDESGIAEEEVSSARVVLETEIKFNEETAITMTILEERDKEVQGAPAPNDDHSDMDEDEGEEEDDEIGQLEGENEPEERRKTPR